MSPAVSITSKKILQIIFFACISILLAGCSSPSRVDQNERFIDNLLKEMTLAEKVGQMQVVHSPGRFDNEWLMDKLRNGQVGAILNEAHPEMIRKFQETAVEQGRLGIPLLFGRDVIHGFKTIFPINIGQAATFNPALVTYGAQIAAREAGSVGLNWNFAPMVDISRDPRWGRMAESFGEDPFLVTEMGLAVMNGFQGDDLRLPYTMAACAKHFAGYGAAEGGRDYNTTSIPDVDLWNIHLRPFRALSDAGIATFMTGFNELNGIPASGNAFLFRDILKDRWQFNGFVVSDWASVVEMKEHGFAADDREAAYKALRAGVDMEMASSSYEDHLEELVKTGMISEDLIDDAVRRILRVKLDLGLFDKPYVDQDSIIFSPPASHLEAAREMALQSFVLLKNHKRVLPLKREMEKVAVIGPMAHDRYEQLGTWIFDGDTNLSITPLMGLQDLLGNNRVYHAKGLSHTRSFEKSGFDKARQAAAGATAVIMFLGEESIITGEAHSRAYLDLPGAQNELVMEMAKTGKPLILVIMTPRPLTIGEISEYADAVLYAWHPGTMAGPALADVLFGLESPSGKLPVTFVKAPGQIPMYYAHKNTGRPFSKESFVHIDDIPVRGFQTSLGNTSHYLDVGFEPLYPFGYGLSYTEFEYSDLKISADELMKDETLDIQVTLSNTGDFEAEEVVQLYIRDLAASITRPVKELKDFKRIRLKPGESRAVNFRLSPDRLGFYDQNGNYIVEPGEFILWIGGSSEALLSLPFTLK
ncbi:MAG: glycoside hydrolase family 3 N-terminal domain-containing protein [Bacteroidales bacterium]